MIKLFFFLIFFIKKMFLFVCLFFFKDNAVVILLVCLFQRAMAMLVCLFQLGATAEVGIVRVKGYGGHGDRKDHKGHIGHADYRHHPEGGGTGFGYAMSDKQAGSKLAQAKNAFQSALTMEPAKGKAMDHYICRFLSLFTVYSRP